MAELVVAEATETVPVQPGTGTAVEHPAAEHAVFPPFDSSTFASQLFWLAITFVALYYLLAKVAIPRISGILTERGGRIAADVDKAERAKTESEAALAAYEKALAAARSNASTIAEGARVAAKTAADAERTETEAALASKLMAAEASIGEIKKRALQDVGSIASEATAAIVKALIDADVGKADAEAAVARAMGK